MSEITGRDSPGDKRLEAMLNMEAGQSSPEPITMTFEEAVATLPPYCDDRDEIDWIRAHPAMARKARHEAMGIVDSIVVRTEDILSPPHGPAPSQSTAYALQHWVNNPDKFFSMVLQEQKKQLETERKRDENMDVEDDLDFIDQMIKDIKRDHLQDIREWEKQKKTARGKRQS